MKSRNSKPIIIAGGGIGGLSTAMGLSQKGFHSVVLEKTSSFSEIGAGIQLGPNAFHAFDYLGVGDRAREMAVYIDSLRLMDAVSGQQIVRIALDGEFRERFNNPYAVVHRGDLHRVFLHACESSELVELRANTTVSGYKRISDGVLVRLDDLSEAEGVALIGADGLWSKVRSQLVGDGPPRVSGHTTYRSVIETSDMPQQIRWNAATLWAGPKCHIVHYPLSDWNYFNLVVTYHNDAPKPVAGAPVTHDVVRKGFEHVNSVARQVIERGRNWKLWVLCDRDPISNWVDGPVTLLGDAAHPMLQYFAQGACMAMEDAVCLTDEMERQDGDVETAFANYRDRRYLRTAKIQLMSRLIGDHIYHCTDAHAQLRNSIMGEKSQSDWCDTLSWIYGSTGIEGAV